MLRFCGDVQTNTSSIGSLYVLFFSLWRIISLMYFVWIALRLEKVYLYNGRLLKCNITNLSFVSKCSSNVFQSFQNIFSAYPLLFIEISVAVYDVEKHFNNLISPYDIWNSNKVIMTMVNDYWLEIINDFVTDTENCWT